MPTAEDGSQVTRTQRERATGEWRKETFKQTASPEHAKHRAQDLAKLARDLEKERRLEEVRACKLATPKSGSKSVGASPAKGTPATVKPEGALDSELLPRSLASAMDVEGANSSSSATNKESESQQQQEQPPSQPSNAELLEAVHSLSAKFAKLATKEDLATLKAEVTQEIGSKAKEAAQEAVEPVRKEVGELRSRVTNLEKGSYSKDLSDPAPKRVEFKKFNEQTTATQRLEAMKTFCAKYPGPTSLSSETG